MFPTQPTQFVDNKTSDFSSNSSASIYIDVDNFNLFEEEEREQLEKDKIRSQQLNEEMLDENGGFKNSIPYEELTEEGKKEADWLKKTVESFIVHGSDK